MVGVRKGKTIMAIINLVKRWEMRRKKERMEELGSRETGQVVANK